MQWNIILFLAFALVIAAFAVVNMDTVTINYLFGDTTVPLILIIIGSALAGSLMIASFNIMTQMSNYRKIKELKERIMFLESELADYKQEKEQQDITHFSFDDNVIIDEKN
ncbi:hypothetical protein BHU72_08685 [Desulfuribacillus stibiiarsenatis]|uniref:Lipopolysaccharide assembly protein A domain-containing protein n=1 Tax=Desulfuribacillus stibiiarsenatis TaxID=1390249 RepID=A0A1E5L3B7_9FIRM|nr:lipopolysaccharide assembly protein LapA domain-containing protein [Desulfuribacillus stibiiarsenatis]OEH84571.1 hypothetical protein BHU72_08685 [Desulfuribacillus stibiiarsenatis]